MSVGSLHHPHEQGLDEVVLRVTQGDGSRTAGARRLAKQAVPKVPGLLFQAAMRCARAQRAFPRRHRLHDERDLQPAAQLPGKGDFRDALAGGTDSVIHDAGDKRESASGPERGQRAHQRC
jgi:hypothetical protein